MPLERDPSRGNELFLRLPPPNSDIIVTPPRPSDVEDQIERMNDLSVTKWLQGPPYPYTLQDSKEWNALITKRCDEAKASYEKRLRGEGPKWLEFAPVCTIREDNASTGAQKYLGSVDIRRAIYEEIINEGERAKAKAANDAFESGDERILWNIGDHLAKSHHGRGIMTAAVRAYIDDIAVPLLNAHTIHASYFSENIGSKRVFEKNGFIHTGIVPDAYTLPEEKGGQTVSLGVMLWSRPSKP